MKARLWSLKVFLFISIVFSLVGCTKGVIPGFGILNSNNNTFVDGGSLDGQTPYLLNSSRTPTLASYNNQLYLVSAGGPSGGIETYLYNGQDSQPAWNNYGFASPQSPPGLASNPALAVSSYNGTLYGVYAEANTGSTFSNVTQIYAGYLSGNIWSFLGGPSSCGTANCLNFAPGQNASTPAAVVLPAATPAMVVFWSETAAAGGSNVEVAKLPTQTGVWTTPIPLNRYTQSTATNPHAIISAGQIFVTWAETGANGAAPSLIHVDSSSDGSSYSSGDGTTLPNLQSGINNATNPFLALYNSNIYLSWLGNYTGASVVRVAMYNTTDSSWLAADGGSNSGLNFNPSANAVGTPKMVEGVDNNLYIIWTEVFSGITQIHIKKYNGSIWSWVDASGPTGLNFNSSINANAPSLTLFNGEIYSSWEEFNSGGGPDLSRVRVLY